MLQWDPEEWEKQSFLEISRRQLDKDLSNLT